jgi:hypothetical protein
VLGTAAALTVSPAANADAKRLNDVVVANVDTVQHQADCATDLKINPPLRLVALWHADDVLNNRLWTTTSWSDGSTVQDRANAAGYKGVASETVAINPALAISGLESKNYWCYQLDYIAIMSNCANTQIGLWSENSRDRTVEVAIHASPAESCRLRFRDSAIGSLDALCSTCRRFGGQAAAGMLVARRAVMTTRTFDHAATTLRCWRCTGIAEGAPG